MNINIEQANIKDLNKSRKHLMRALHHTFGYDFNKAYTFHHIHGKFTVKSLKPYINEKSDFSVILIKGKYSWDANTLYCVKYSEYDGGGIDIELYGRYGYDRHNRLYFDGASKDKFDYLTRKCDFEDMRKDPNVDAWVLSQDLKLMKYPAPPVGEHMGIRYKYNDHDLIPYGYKGAYLGAYHSLHYTESDLDKSGYLIDEYRNDLKSRAKARKKQREKDAYLATDNSDKVATLARLIAQYKAKVAEDLIKADTTDAIYEVSKHLDYFSGLRGIMEDFDTFKEKTENKDFESINASNALYDRINKAIYEYL